MQMIYMMISFGMLIIISIPNIRNAIGNAANTIFGPSIGFNGAYPLLTVIIAGVMIGLITSVPRYFFTDWINYGRMQTRSRAYSKAIRDAYKSQQRDKIQKLNKMRMEMMTQQQQVQMQTMKPLMILTIFTLFIFIWIYVFLATLPYDIISFPWDTHVNISTSKLWIMPTWIALYFIASLVIGYFATMIIKYLDFSYKLRKYDDTDRDQAEWTSQ